ncbi:MAG: hypothetical protein U0667_16460 [Chloroflexota bacterium]
MSRPWRIDALSRVTAVDHARDGTPLLELGYAHDALGRLTSRTDDQGTTTFAYDGYLDRLTSADYPGPGDYARVRRGGQHHLRGLALGHGRPGMTPRTASPMPASCTTTPVGPAHRRHPHLLLRRPGQAHRRSGGGHAAAYLLDGDGTGVSQTVDSGHHALDLDLRGDLSSVLAAGDQGLPAGAPVPGPRRRAPAGPPPSPTPKLGARGGGCRGRHGPRRPLRPPTAGCVGLDPA